MGKTAFPQECLNKRVILKATRNNDFDSSSKTTEGNNVSCEPVGLNNEESIEETEQRDEEATAGSQLEDMTLVNAIAVDSEDITVLSNENYKTLVDHILEMKSMLRLVLHKIDLDEDQMPLINKNVLNDDQIRNIIPVDSIEQLLSLEDNLKSNEEVSDQLFNKVLLAGGRDYKDACKRSLAIIFTNNVASMCSWTGQKNNFKLSDTRIMRVVRAAIRKLYPHITDKDFEMNVMNWFRFAKQRMERK